MGYILQVSKLLSDCGYTYFRIVVELWGSWRCIADSSPFRFKQQYSSNAFLVLNECRQLIYEFYNINNTNTEFLSTRKTAYFGILLKNNCSSCPFIRILWLGNVATEADCHSNAMHIQVWLLNRSLHLYKWVFCLCFILRYCWCTIHLPVVLLLPWLASTWELLENKVKQKERDVCFSRYLSSPSPELAWVS